MSVGQLIKERRKDILKIAAKHGAKRVRVFGSVARGEADEKSDLDLLVEFEPHRGLLDHASLMNQLEELLGCRVDVASEQGLRPRIRERIMREATLL